MRNSATKTLFVGLVVLAAAAGSPLCDPQCNTTVHAPYSVAPAVSICVAAATGQVHDFFDTHEESDTATGLGISVAALQDRCDSFCTAGSGSQDGDDDISGPVWDMCSGCDDGVVATVCGFCDGNAQALAMCTDIGAPVCETHPGDAVGGVEERLSSDVLSAAACALLVAQHRTNANGMSWNHVTGTCYSEIGATSLNNDSRYLTCIFGPPVTPPPATSAPTNHDDDDNAPSADSEGGNPNVVDATNNPPPTPAPTPAPTTSVGLGDRLDGDSDHEQGDSGERGGMDTGKNMGSKGGSKGGMGSSRGGSKDATGKGTGKLQSQSKGDAGDPPSNTSWAVLGSTIASLVTLVALVSLVVVRRRRYRQSYKSVDLGNNVSPSLASEDQPLLEGREPAPQVQLQGAAF